MIKTDNVYDHKNITGKAWRLIHYQGKVVALVEGTDKSVTSYPAKYTGLEFSTKDEAFKEIEKLGLEYEDESRLAK